MPPELLPLDRKDLFEEKKHERNDSLSSSGKWRDFYEGSGDFTSQQRNRDDEGQRQIGPSKQGSYQLFPQESGHGSMFRMSADLRLPEMMLEDENCRFSASRIDGKFSRHNREYKASDIASRFGPRDWKGYQWESGDACVNSSDRNGHVVAAQRPVDDVPTYPTHIQPVTENSWDQIPFKDQHNKMSVEGLATGHKPNLNFARCSEDIETRIDRLGSFDNHVGGNQCYSQDHSLSSIAWKPLKWTRSSSLSSRGSVLSQATSSKSVKTEFDERPELPGKVTPAQSPSGDTAVGVTSAAPFEDTCPRKKQRLGWGQGLAKYEKEKVEGPEETTGKIELVQSANTKAVHNLVTSFPDGSPKLMGRSGCASPATPSVVCSSSPGVEEKSYVKSAANVNDTRHFSDSPGHSYRGCTEEFSPNLEHLDLNLHCTVNSLLADLLQPEDTSLGDSFGKPISMNKLLSLKSDILKTLEKTECEIDLFENELRSLNSELERNSPCSLALQSCKEEDGASTMIKEPNSWDVCAQVPTADLVVPIPPVCHETLDIVAEVKDEEIDSVRSQHCEPDMLKLIGAADVEAAMFAGPEVSNFTSFVDRKTLEAVDKGGFGNCSILHESRTNSGSGSSRRLQSEEDGTLTDLILASNKNSAKIASEALAILLPADLPLSKFGAADSSASCWRDDTHIREKFAMKKSFLRFKERVLTLKFRAFHHLWKEDMRLLSIRKYRAKSQKRFELGCRATHSGFQKHRSSIRARFTSPVGNLTLVPTTEIVDFATKLLSDSHMKLYRNSLKMPALVLDEKERKHSMFITNNGLVIDPVVVDKERALINPWTSEEKEVFTEMLATFGKDFSKIASFLNHKTTADCVEFYYKNRKSESFTKIKKRLELKKQGSCFPINSYLVTSGKKWHREANAASLDILGAASVVAAHAEESVKTRLTCAGRSILGGYFNAKMFQVDGGASERTSEVEKNDKEAAAADVLAGICGALSSEAMSSCITSSVDPDEWKCQRKSPMTMDRPVTSEVTQKFDEDDSCSDESCGDVGPVDWTDEEKSIFIGALRAFGRDFASISCCLGTRSQDQCKIFFSKARKCLGLDDIHQGSRNQGTPTSDGNGGRSDTEDACVVEMDSVVCSTRSCSKMDLDQPSLIGSRSSQDCGQSGNNVGGAEVDESSGMDEKMARSDEPDVGGKSPVAGDYQVDLVKPDEEKPVYVGEIQRDITPDASGDAVLSCNLSAQLSKDAGLFVDMEMKEQEGDRSITSSKSVCAEGSREVTQSRLDLPVGLKQEGEAGSGSNEGFKAEEEQKEVPVQPLPQSGSDGRENARTGGLDARNTSSGSSFPDSDVNRSCSDRSGFSFVPNCEPQMPLELLLQKPQVISWQQHQKVNCPYVPGEPLVLSPDSSIAPIFNGHVNPQYDVKKQHQKSVGLDFYRHHPDGCQPLDRPIDQEGLPVLTGLPVHMLSKKEEMNGAADLISEKQQPAVIQNTLNTSRSISFQSSQFFLPELYKEKCDGSKPPHPGPELLFLPKPHDKPDDPLKALMQTLEKKQSRSYEPEEQSHYPGDVKLFGQILTHMPPMQKSKPPQENEEKPVSLKTDMAAFTLKCSEQREDAAYLVPKLEPSNYRAALEEIPKPTFGFWNGNIVQTGGGLLSLPECGVLSNYPAFNDNYQGVAPCRVAKQPVVKRNDCRNLGSPAFPAKDISNSSRRVDYPLLRSYDEPAGSVQPLAADGQRVDMFADVVQKHIVVSGLVCPSSMGRGILGSGVGGGVVSDPVAAIKKHYADRLQAGIRGEEESWKGDRSR